MTWSYFKLFNVLQVFHAHLNNDTVEEIFNNYEIKLTLLIVTKQFSLFNFANLNDFDNFL